MPYWLIISIGVVLVLGTIQEVFQDLFHPSESGALSDLVGRGVFRGLRGTRLFPAAGALALVLVIATWVMLLCLGFALLYYVAYPDYFRNTQGAVPSTPHFWSVVYFSLEVMSTLGLGDIAPVPSGLRLLVTTEAFIGFGVLTASVSWIVLLYPALARMRLLARGMSVLARAEVDTGTTLADTESEVFLAALSRDVVRTHVDLVHFPIIYYFASKDRRASVAYSLRHAVRFAQQAGEPHHTKAVRAAGASLNRALDDLAEILVQRFLRKETGSRDAVFRRYAKEHLVGE